MSICVIIPSRTDANLNACVSAIREMGETCQVVVVDDGLTIHRSDCYYIPGQKPFIFSRAVNDGIRAAGKHTGYVISNDDALLKTPGGFAAIAWAAHDNPEYGVVASTCNNVGNINQHPRGGAGIREEPRMVCFVAVYIPRTTIERVGLLDESLIGYGMDDDAYCLEVRKAGLKIGIYDGCFVDHSSLVSTFRGGPEASGDFKPNLRRFIAKYGHDNRGLTKEQSPWRELFN